MGLKLTDLNPCWSHEVDRRGRSGLTFDCPCCRQIRLNVSIFNPIDGGGPTMDRRSWHRTGEVFESLSLSPSIDFSAQGHWHGFLTNGEVR